jgi:hypothetical protein
VSGSILLVILVSQGSCSQGLLLFPLLLVAVDHILKWCPECILLSLEPFLAPSLFLFSKLFLYLFFGLLLFFILF